METNNTTAPAESNESSEVTTEAWLEARLELLELEKQHTRRGDELSAMRRKLPWRPVAKDYVFEGPDGSVHLEDLFGPHSQLIVYHFMYGADWEEPCVSCAFWADHFGGTLAHLAGRDAAFAAVSTAPIEKLGAFQDRMGWKHRWVSAGNSSFRRDFGVPFDKAAGTACGDGACADGLDGGASEAELEESPGISVFAKDSSGKVFHTYSCFQRGMEGANATYSLLDLLPKGRDEERLPWSMAWVAFSDAGE